MDAEEGHTEDLSQQGRASISEEDINTILDALLVSRIVLPEMAEQIDAEIEMLQIAKEYATK